MEKRNVQVTGGSSFIVTLPKEWIKKQKIKKNQKIGITIQSNGKLIISPKYISKKEERVRIFKVTNELDNDLLVRLLIGAYISANDVIIVESEVRIDARVRECVLSFLNSVTGFIIVEETETQIKMKNTVDNEEIPIKNGILRISLLVASMFQDSFIALENQDQELYQKIIKRDETINSSHWLIMRQLNHLTLQNKTFMDLPMAITSNVSFISQYVERIGNQCVQIATWISELIALQPDTEIREIFKEIAEYIIELFNQSLLGFFDFDVRNANMYIRKGLSMSTQCEPLRKYVKKNPEFAYPVKNIMENFITIGDIISNIGEMTLDSYVVLTNPSIEQTDERIKNLIKFYEY